MKPVFLLLLPIFCLSSCLYAQTKPDFTKESIDSLIQLQKETFELPGLAVGIMIDNKIYYSNALGVQDLNNQQPLTTSSLFHMASVSKPFVATAIMQLVEQGKINLEDKLIDYLPYFSMTDSRYKKITIQQMLNHTSGIPDVKDYEWDRPQVDKEAAERYAKSFKNEVLDFEPGKEWNYSNAAFDILGDVIAKVSGMSFEDYIKKYIFEPTGMKNSTFFKPDVPTEIATSPHSMGDDLSMEVLEVYPYNRIHAPSSTLHSNVEDLFKWAMLNLNQGSLNGSQVFTPAVYQQLTNPTAEVNNNLSVCLSWFTREIEGKKFYYHSGGDEGYATFFGFMPELKAAVFVMGNSDFFRSSTTALHLAKTFIFGQPSPWKKYIHVELKNRILREGIEECKKFYYQAQKNESELYQFGGGYMDQLGYWLLDRGYQKEALDIFLFNVELEPKESGFYDSVGDAYRAMDQKSKAIQWYEKALELNPKQDFTIKKLKELKNSKK